MKLDLQINLNRERKQMFFDGVLRQSTYTMGQGTLTEGEGSVQSTFLYQIVLFLILQKFFTLFQYNLPYRGGQLC